MVINFVAQIPGAGVGFIVGAFTPAVGRKLKSLFVKETTAVKSAVVSEVKKVDTSVKTDAEKIASKL